jgi:NADPH:quinone reductase
MFAHRIVVFTGPDDVQWTEVAEPAADGGVVIEVAAAGVSFADLLQTTGAYQMRPPIPYTPGMDAAGVVRSAPPGAGLAVGQHVAVLLSHGCWQEVVSAPPARVLPVPDDMSFEAAAAAPFNYLTALFALARRARARAGETVLVHGAAGGVGTAAIQLGRALGLRTVAVVSDQAKKEFALACGADAAVLSDGWLATVRELEGERRIDIVIDPVGGDRVTDSLRSLAPEGRLVVLGFTGGETLLTRCRLLRRRARPRLWCRSSDGERQKFAAALRQAALSRQAPLQLPERKLPARLAITRHFRAPGFAPQRPARAPVAG